MAITTPVLASTNLPQVAAQDGFSYAKLYRGSGVRLGNGTLAYDLVDDAVKRTFELSWRNISETNRDTVNTAYHAIRKTSGAFTAPDGQTATVNRAEDQPELRWSSAKGPGGTLVWSTTMRLEEV
ncbi:MAG: hypothetical protein KAX65_00570 [Caldilineaceae bacterium]|nr:hypothetical protein [Caldilineaceae bacterium]